MKKHKKSKTLCPFFAGDGFCLIYMFRMKVSTVTVATVHVHQLKTFASHNRKLRIQSYHIHPANVNIRRTYLLNFFVKSRIIYVIFLKERFS